MNSFEFIPELNDFGEIDQQSFRSLSKSSSVGSSRSFHFTRNSLESQLFQDNLFPESIQGLSDADWKNSVDENQHEESKWNLPTNQVAQKQVQNSAFNLTVNVNAIDGNGKYSAEYLAYLNDFQKKQPHGRGDFPPSLMMPDHNLVYDNNLQIIPEMAQKKSPILANRMLPGDGYRNSPSFQEMKSLATSPQSGSSIPIQAQLAQHMAQAYPPKNFLEQNLPPNFPQFSPKNQNFPAHLQQQQQLCGANNLHGGFRGQQQQALPDFAPRVADFQVVSGQPMAPQHQQLVQQGRPYNQGPGNNNMGLNSPRNMYETNYNNTNNFNSNMNNNMNNNNSYNNNMNNNNFNNNNNSFNNLNGMNSYQSAQLLSFKNQSSFQNNQQLNNNHSLSLSNPNLKSISTGYGNGQMVIPNYQRTVYKKQPLNMDIVYTVAFKRNSKEYLLGGPPMLLDLGTAVIVATDRGEHIGFVTRAQNTSDFLMERFNSPYMMADFDITQFVGRIIRVATPKECQALVQKSKDEEQIMDYATHLINNVYCFKMKLLDVEYQFDRFQITCFYHSKQRVDFRDFVKDLHETYNARIWMELEKRKKGEDDNQFVYRC